MKVLQYCNVGNVVGGTGACAWSVVRSFPDLSHHVVFRSAVTPETHAAFEGCEVSTREQLADCDLDEISPDLVLLHNIDRRHVKLSTQRMTTPSTIQYVHSKGPEHAAADLTICCSEYLRDLIDDSGLVVVYQGVPRPLNGTVRERYEGKELSVGRICTPIKRKWPSSLIHFYEQLSFNHADVCWEFVGCPDEMKKSLQEACGGKARFHPAGSHARQLIPKWDAMLYHNPNIPETFGRTVAEAMRAGTIPIVDNLGGFREQVDADTGYLCSNLDEFSEALMQLRDPLVLRTRSRLCGLLANERFSFRAFRGRMLNTFLELIL